MWGKLNNYGITAYKVTSHDMHTRNDTKWTIGERMAINIPYPSDPEEAKDPSLYYFAFTHPDIAALLAQIYCGAGCSRMFKATVTGWSVDKEGIKIAARTMRPDEEIPYPLLTDHERFAALLEAVHRYETSVYGHTNEVLVRRIEKWLSGDRRTVDNETWGDPSIAQIAVGLAHGSLMSGEITDAILRMSDYLYRPEAGQAFRLGIARERLMTALGHIKGDSNGSV